MNSDEESNIQDFYKVAHKDASAIHEKGNNSQAIKFVDDILKAKAPPYKRVSLSWFAPLLMRSSIALS